MDVVSLAPVPVASLTWRRGDGGWALSVACKITIDLRPDSSHLAKSHDPIYEQDEPGSIVARLRAPSDLVPTRPMVDVTLSGRAYPSSNNAADTLARLHIGSIDKRVAIDSKRAAAPPSAPTRLAPLGSSWPARKALLRGRPEPTLQANGDPCILPAEFDLAFFNTAPPDQRLDELAVDAELVLEHLHPKHAKLHTCLPNLAPQAFVERQPGKRHEQAMHIDGMWIDSSRGVATLTWRAQVALEHADDPGKVWVAVAGAGRRLNFQQLSRLIASLGGREEPPAKNDVASEEGASTVSMRAKRIVGSEGTKTSVLSRMSIEEQIEHTEDGLPASFDDNAPSWLSSRIMEPPKTSPPPPPASTSHSSAVAPPPPKPPEAPAAPAAPTAPTAPASQAQVARRPVPPPRSPMTTNLGIGPPHASPWSRSNPVPPSPPSPPVERRDQRLEDTSSLPRLAATDAEPAPKKKTPKRPQHPQSIVELLWFEQEATSRLRRRWPELAEDLEFAPRDPDHDLSDDVEPQLARAHHTHFGLLTEAALTELSTLPARVREAVSATGRFTPPLLLLEGELRFPFDQSEILRATAATIAPDDKDHRKLQHALEQVQSHLDTPLLSGSTETVTRLNNHLRQLYRESKRSLSLDYLDETVERMLLEQRRYQKRTLFGGTWIRALLITSSSGATERTIVSYLPESLETRLPLMLAFPARLIAEAHLKQDQYENHAHALRVVTLGRIAKL